MPVAPYVPSYASRTPYLTVTEFLNAPTSVDITDLVPGGTEAQQTQALSDVIARASSWVDDECQQILAATVDLAAGRFRVDRYGMIRVPLPFKPVLEVQSVSIGWQVNNLTALTDLSGVEFGQHGTIGVPAGTPAGMFPPGGYAPGDRPYVQVQYVNGWPNTTITADATQAATTVTVASSVGVYPATVLTVYDGSSTETVTVASVTGTTLTLTSPLAFAHTAGTPLSALPPKVKQACILLTTALIQTRGNDAIVLSEMVEPHATQSKDAATTETVMLALDLLGALRRAV